MHEQSRKAKQREPRGGAQQQITYLMLRDCPARRPADLDYTDTSASLLLNHKWDPENLPKYLVHQCGAQVQLKHEVQT